MRLTTAAIRWPLMISVAMATSAMLAAPAAAAPSARVARTLNVSQTATLHLVRRSGSTIYQRGTATGTLPGAVNARINVSIVGGVTGTVTFRPRGGSVTFSVQGAPRSTGIRARFTGTMRVIDGTGRYEGAEGATAVDAIVNRRSWDATVRAIGAIRY